MEEEFWLESWCLLSGGERSLLRVGSPKLFSAPACGSAQQGFVRATQSSSPSKPGFGWWIQCQKGAELRDSRLPHTSSRAPDTSHLIDCISETRIPLENRSTNPLEAPPNSERPPTMAPKESEAAAYATTSATDFYEILGIPVDDISESALRKAFRKQSIKWHPDKNPDPAAAEKFHMLTVAYDVLSDPATKAAYDNARTARLAKKRRAEAFDMQRRKMQEDLESREGTAKKQKTEQENEEARFQAQLAKLQEEGARLRQKREEALRAAAKEAEDQKEQAEEEERAKNVPVSRFTELDRTVSVRWRRKGEGEKIDGNMLRDMFKQYGKIQETVFRKAGEDKKIQSGLIVFESILGAHAAVRGAPDNKDAAFKPIKSVNWASGKEPDISGMPKEPATPPPPALPKKSSAPTTPGVSSFPGSPARPAFIPSAGTPRDRLRKVPSFASFGGTPQKVSAQAAAAASPDYESITLMRMRDAERKRIEEELRKQEEQATEENKE